jgi:hypothetical protein
LVSLPDGDGLWIVDQVRWESPGASGDRAARYLATLLTNLGCELQVIRGEAIAATDMEATGRLFGSVQDGVAFATNGQIETEVEFATGGRYTFGVLASGTPLDGIYPKVELRLDGTTVATIDLVGPDWQTYRVSVPVQAGVHRVAIAFVNDQWRPPQDRNLLVSRLTIGKAARP